MQLDVRLFLMELYCVVDMGLSVVEMLLLVGCLVEVLEDCIDLDKDYYS
jgi:hypothetical protein